jgi:hypothetical protein
MFSFRNLAVSIFGSELSTSLPYSQDLSRYREFQFGTSLLAVAKQAHMKLSEATVIHQCPALIQELNWHARTYSAPPSQADSARDILFSFYNGELFRIVVTYDKDRTEGMTAEDIVEAVSAIYGTATRPAVEIILSSTHLYSNGEKSISDRSEKVIARWEDSQYSLNLFYSRFQSTFGLVMHSKRLDALALAAIIESVRLDKQEAPHREVERQKMKDEETRSRQEAARLVNKAPFRP